MPAPPPKNPQGRRWKPVRYMITCPYEGLSEDSHVLDRMDWMSSDGGSAVIDRAYEYRLVYDSHHDLWRLDIRVHVPGA